MGSTIGTVTDIISRPRDHLGDSNRLFKQYKNTAEQLIKDKDNKYKNFAEISATGLTEEYTTMKRALVNNEQYNITTANAKKNFQEQKLALEEIRKVFTEFQQDAVDFHERAGTKENKADKALEEINKILRRKNVDGNYLFGGKESDKPPVAQGALIARSNVIGPNNDPTANYTEAIKNNAAIKLSDNHSYEILKNRLYAGHPAISKVIGAINIYKVGGDNEEYHIAAREARKELTTLEVEIGKDRERIKKAIRYNQDQNIELKSSFDNLFTNGTVELTMKIADLKRLTQASWFMQQTTKSLEAKFFEKN